MKSSPHCRHNLLGVGHTAQLLAVLLPFLQIYGLRELHEELTALLSQEEAAALGLGSSFAPFAQLAALHVSEFTGAAWATAAAEHERRLEAVEARISQKLKELFGEFTCGKDSCHSTAICGTVQLVLGRLEYMMWRTTSNSSA
jgi:hypothetical protein